MTTAAPVILDLNRAPASSEDRSGSAPQRFVALDSLRGIAACWVVIFHIPATNHLWPLAIVQHGYLAVTFFFVLSGFVIGASYGDRMSSGFAISRFMLLRLGRIYPIHAFMLGTIFAYEIIRLALNLPAFREGTPFTGNTAPTGLLWSLALLQQVPENLSWNRPSWSIGVEYWTYLAFALLAAAVAIRRLYVTAILLGAPWAAWKVIPQFVPTGPAVEIASLIDCMFAFGLGLAVFEVRRSVLWRTVISQLRTATASLIELAVVAAVLLVSTYHGGRLSLLVFPVFAMMVGVFAEQRGLISRVLLTRPMVGLGVLSYSIYMVHQFVLDRMFDLLGALPANLVIAPVAAGRIVLKGLPAACDLAVVVMIAVVIASAALLNRYVETPSRLWSRRVVGRIAAAAR